MKKGFLTKIAYSNGLWMAGLLLLVFSALRDLSFPHSEALKIPLFASLKGVEVLGLPLDLIFKNRYVGYLVRFLMLFGSALLLQFISSGFRLIRVRSFFPFFLFSLFSASLLSMIPLNGASISCLFFCWSIYKLFSGLENGSANKRVFDASFFLALASLFQSRMIYLLPLYWVVMGVLQIFSLRSFWASVVGVCSIFWLIAGASFMVGDFHFLDHFVHNLVDFQLLNSELFNSRQIAYLSFLAFLMISAMFYFWPRQNLDKLRTRNYLNSILLIWFPMLGLWLFSGNDSAFLLALFSLSALMVAHFFSLTDTRYSRVLFILLSALSVAIYVMV